MIFELTETDKAKVLFNGWEDTMIYSCIQKVMGKLFVVDTEAPKSVMACLGCFLFFAGEPCRELVEHKPKGFFILVGQSEGWNKLIETAYGDRCRKVKRYAMRKTTNFDKPYLLSLKNSLLDGYELRMIDADLYDQCLQNEWSEDFVAVFDSKETYLKEGLGVVALKNGEIVSGASSYTRYLEGIEIEVDTKTEERRKSLATCCCAALILECLQRGLYPSWDAQNLWSVHLAEKLGYEFSHEYTAYECEG